MLKKKKKKNLIVEEERNTLKRHQTPNKKTKNKTRSEAVFHVHKKKKRNN